MKNFLVFANNFPAKYNFDLNPLSIFVMPSIKNAKIYDHDPARFARLYTKKCNFDASALVLLQTSL